MKKLLSLVALTPFAASAHTLTEGSLLNEMAHSVLHLVEKVNLPVVGGIALILGVAVVAKKVLSKPATASQENN